MSPVRDDLALLSEDQVANVADGFVRWVNDSRSRIQDARDSCLDEIRSLVLGDENLAGRVAQLVALLASNGEDDEEEDLSHLITTICRECSGFEGSAPGTRDRWNTTKWAQGLDEVSTEENVRQQIRALEKLGWRLRLVGPGGYEHEALEMWGSDEKILVEPEEDRSESGLFVDIYMDDELPEDEREEEWRVYDSDTGEVMWGGGEGATRQDAEREMDRIWGERGCDKEDKPPVNLGSFGIRIYFDPSRRMFPRPYAITSGKGTKVVAGGFTHPHVCEETLCEGDGSIAITNAIGTASLVEFVLLVDGILGTYNPGSPYRKLNEWRKVGTCEICGKGFKDEDSIWHCEEEGCTKVICKPCAREARMRDYYDRRVMDGRGREAHVLCVTHAHTRTCKICGGTQGYVLVCERCRIRRCSACAGEEACCNMATAFRSLHQHWVGGAKGRTAIDQRSLQTNRCIECGRTCEFLYRCRKCGVSACIECMEEQAGGKYLCRTCVRERDTTPDKKVGFVGEAVVPPAMPTTSTPVDIDWAGSSEQRRREAAEQVRQAEPGPINVGYSEQRVTEREADAEIAQRTEHQFGSEGETGNTIAGTRTVDEERQAVEGVGRRGGESLLEYYVRLERLAAASEAGALRVEQERLGRLATRPNVRDESDEDAD